MDLSEYQRLAECTSPSGEEVSKSRANRLGVYSRLVVAAMGLSGEAGEVLEQIKKVIGHDHLLDEDSVENELGDVLWYVAEICNDLGLSMEHVAERNIAKLRRRYPDGFSSERSVNREE